MSGPIGHTYIYNIIILFVVIVFAFLAGTLSYYKAYKVNNKITNSIEKYEGYNSLSKAEIEQNLLSLGYQQGTPNCNATYKGMQLVTVEGSPEIYNYCIYVDVTNPNSGTYYTYGILTRMSIDLPLIDKMTLPVFTKANPIFKFTNS